VVNSKYRKYIALVIILGINIWYECEKYVLFFWFHAQLSDPREPWLRKAFFSCLWLYSPILDLGHLHETLHFISVTRSRTVGRQYSFDGWSAYRKASANCPGWLWWWRSWWNEQFWQGKPKYLEKTCPDATLSTTNPPCQTRAQTRATAVGSQRLTASAMVRPEKGLTMVISCWLL
jgi:hypothetical protein